MSRKELGEIVCGENDVDTVLEVVGEYNVTEFPLGPKGEEFFLKEHKDTDEKYPTCMKLIAILRIANAGTTAVLKLLSENKTNEKEIKNVTTSLFNLRGELRNIWTKNEETCHIIKRFLQFSKGILEVKDQQKVLLCCLVCLQALLRFLIRKIETGTSSELEKYESWLSSIASGLKSILKSDAFKGVVATASSAGIFVLGANVGLSILGFTSAGVAGGSIAAGWMSSIGIVQAGSLFAALQSAGAIGFGIAATGGIALVGGTIGLGGFGIYKAVTRDRDVKVYVKKQDGVAEPITIEFEWDVTVNDLLRQFIPVDVTIPNNVHEIGIHFYDAKTKQKSPLKFKQNEKAKDAFFWKDLLLEKRDPDMKDSVLPFYLKRKGIDLWEIEKNNVTSSW